MTTATQVLDRARSQLGIAENPPGSNNTPYTQWYGLRGPWCAIFVSWCFYNSGLPLPASTSKGFAYCPSGVDWFQRNRLWQPASALPSPGWVVFYSWDGGRAEHTGIVESATSPGHIVAIEGNTDNAGGFSGGQVMRRARSFGIIGYGTPHFGGDVPPPPRPPPVPTWKVPPVHNPPIQLVDFCDTPSHDGGLLLGADGAVYTTGKAPYLGGANTKPYFAGRTAAQIHTEKRTDVPSGWGYVIVATTGESYHYPGP